MRRALRAAGAAALMSVLAAAAARADEPLSADRLKAAADEFDLGRRAYLAKDFDQAAVHFESAFRDAPRAETLRLAIRARREAKQPARAATLAAVAEERYPTDAQTAQLAKETLEEGRPLLNEYAIDCAPECAVTADGRVVSQADARHLRVFLDPGTHALGVSFRTGSLSKTVEARKGGRDALTFEAPPAPATPPVAPAPEPSPAAARPPPPEKPVEHHKPLSPIVFWIGAGVTVAAGATMIWSGIDAQNDPGVDKVKAECAGKDESCPAYKDGRAAQLRTNVLIGATAGMGVITAVIGLFLTDWGGKKSLGFAPMPGGGALYGGARF